MVVTETNLKDCFIIQPNVMEDARGFFYERYNKKRFEDIIGYPVNFVQDNISKSQYGVVRGLHFQKGAASQAKLVGVLEGRVLDVAIDLRKKSSSFGQVFSIELSEENRKQVFMPKGFAHGFSVLSDSAIFFYKCDAYYNNASEAGIIYNDTQLAIDWGVPPDKMILTDKDLKLSSFNESYIFQNE